MPDRDKLIELLDYIRYSQEFSCYDLYDMSDAAEPIADFLISKGVTVQNWRDAKIAPPVTPEDFLAKVESIYGNGGDPEVFHDKTDTLMEDILIAFGYQKGIEFLRSKVRWSA